MNKEAKPDNLLKAKAALILDQPFFASLLLSMPISEDNSIATLATDGESIIYNAEFLSNLSVNETIFVLAHETLHCALMHMYRRNDRDLNKWNIAADHVINDTLDRENVGSMPEGALLDHDLIKQGNGTAEGIYNVLPDNPDNSKGDSDQSQGDGQPSQGQGNGDQDSDQSSNYPSAGQPGGALDQVNDASNDPAENAEKESEMRVKVLQAANAAKMAGKLSAGLKRLVGEATETRTDWRAILRRFLSERAKVDYSFARPKRRFLADDLYLPSLTGEKLGKIVIAVDCSGSISESIIAEFESEIKAIIEDTSPTSIDVLYFDTEILRADHFELDDEFIIKPTGGGGTAFSPIFEYIEKEALEVSACVVLTDLCCNDFGEPPICPVLWASTDPGDVPFGETVLIKE